MSRQFCRDDQITDNQEGNVADDYIAEVDRMTSRRVRLEARRQKAIRDLAEAESHVAVAKARKNRSEIRAAWRLVEARLADLKRIERLMTSSPGASSSHRGTGSIWPVHAEGAVHRGDPDPGPRVSDGKRHPVKVAQA